MTDILPLLQNQGLLAFIAGLRATTRDDLPAAPDSLVENLVVERRWAEVQQLLKEYLVELSRCSEERSTSGRMAAEWGRCIIDYAKLRAGRDGEDVAAEDHPSPELFMRFVTSMICGRPTPPDLEVDWYGGLQKAGTKLVLKLGETKSKKSDGEEPCLCRAIEWRNVGQYCR